FSRWGDQAKGKLAFSPFGQITSVQVSPTGDFMATGTSSSSLVLWDLRTLDIPRLFSLPLASALPAHLTAAREMRQYAGIPQWVQAPLDFLILMLQRKFQYDIQVDEIIQIQAGEFDIMIDGIEGVEADEEMV
ncbi:MAG TPA: WD40 repeat domain-containing protein, partial [Anaerolineaceae bacterium]|nr:WD40 repeat domain-containing protein [Anaerolineaceae bacterium]